jgi:hypothetical protein
MEDQVENLEEARKIIKNLRERYRTQSHQLLAWRRRVKAQVIKNMIFVLMEMYTKNRKE